MTGHEVDWKNLGIGGFKFRGGLKYELNFPSHPLIYKAHIASSANIGCGKVSSKSQDSKTLPKTHINSLEYTTCARACTHTHTHTHSRIHMFFSDSNNKSFAMCMF